MKIIFWAAGLAILGLAANGIHMFKSGASTLFLLPRAGLPKALFWSLCALPPAALALCLFHLVSPLYLLGTLVLLLVFWEGYSIFRRARRLHKIEEAFERESTNSRTADDLD